MNEVPVIVFILAAFIEAVVTAVLYYFERSGRAAVVMYATAMLLISVVRFMGVGKMTPLESGAMWLTIFIVCFGCLHILVDHFRKSKS